MWKRKRKLGKGVSSNQRIDKEIRVVEITWKIFGSRWKIATTMHTGPGLASNYQISIGIRAEFQLPFIYSRIGNRRRNFRAARNASLWTSKDTLPAKIGDRHALITSIVRRFAVVRKNVSRATCSTLFSLSANSRSPLLFRGGEGGINFERKCERCMHFHERGGFSFEFLRGIVECFSYF